MVRTQARSAALSAAVLVSALSATALGQDVGMAPPTRAEGSPPAQPAQPAQTTTTTTTTTQTPADTGVAPTQASTYDTQAPVTDDDSIGSRRVAGGHEPLLDTETQRLTWPNVPLMVTGATVFAASYIPAIVGAVVSDRGDDKLYVPLVGPWTTLAKGPDESNGQKALLIADGAVQGLGALMLVTSFFIPEKTTKNWYLIGSNDVRLTPTAGFGSTGVAASGRF